MTVSVLTASAFRW